MSKQRKTLLLTFCVIFVLGSAAAFLLAAEKNAHFWISYIFGVLALSGFFFGGWVTVGDTSQPSAFLSSTVSGIYLVATGVAIYYGYIKLGYISVRLPAGWYAAIHLVLLAAYLTVMIIGRSGHQYIGEQGEQTRRQVLKARMDVERLVQLSELAEDLPEDVRAEVKRSLHEVEEKLRYTDPMADEATAQQAGEVESALDSLEEAVDAWSAGGGDLSAFQQQVKVTLRKIDAYSRAKKLMKR